MSGSIMLDSNVWIYAFMKGDDKRIIDATQLVEESENIILTTQIINEVCHVLLRKYRATDKSIVNYIDYFYEEYPVVVIGEETIRLASTLRIDKQFSFWDSLIVASALENNCTILFSEDMQHGQMVEEKLLIQNPFQL